LLLQSVAEGKGDFGYNAKTEYVDAESRNYRSYKVTRVALKMLHQLPE
jgi:hypothetical protein